MLVDVLNFDQKYKGFRGVLTCFVCSVTKYIIILAHYCTVLEVVARTVHSLPECKCCSNHPLALSPFGSLLQLNRDLRNFPRLLLLGWHHERCRFRIEHIASRAIISKL